MSNENMEAARESLAKLVEGGSGEDNVLPAVGAPSSTFTVWGVRELLAWQEPEGWDLLGKGLLRKGELSVLYGAGGLGKSRLALWLACCQITSRPFAGLPTNEGEPQTWLFIGNENSIARQKGDVSGMLANFTADDIAKLEKHLRFHVMETPDDCILDLSDVAVANRLEATIDSVKAGVVVLDPWGALTLDEDKGQEARATIKTLSAIWKRTVPAAAVLVLAHARVGQATLQAGISAFGAGSALKGSKVLWSTARCVMMLAPRGDDPNELVFLCDKCNNGPKFSPRGLLYAQDPMRYDLDTAFDESAWRNDVDGTRCKSKTVTVADVAAAVADGCHRTQDLIEKFSDLAKEATVKRRLAEAVRLSYIEASTPRGTYVTGKKQLSKSR